MKRIVSIFICIALLCALFAGCGSYNEVYVPTGDGLGGVEAPPSATEPPDQVLTLT